MGHRAVESLVTAQIRHFPTKCQPCLFTASGLAAIRKAVRARKVIEGLENTVDNLPMGQAALSPGTTHDRDRPRDGNRQAMEAMRMATVPTPTWARVMTLVPLAAA